MIKLGNRIYRFMRKCCLNVVFNELLRVIYPLRNYRLERSLNAKLWEIDIDELEFFDRCLTPVISATNLVCILPLFGFKYHGLS